MSANVETEKRYQIRGRYPNGNKWQFAINGWDLNDARKRAEKMAKSGQVIDDVVLLEPRKTRFI